jgi:hypothetical protein
MEAAQAQLRKQMESMPPEQRKQMEEVQKQMERSAGSSGKPGRSARSSEPVKYEPLGQKKQIAGHSCELYRIVRGAGGTEKACLIPWSAGAVKKDELKVFDSLGNFMAVMTESMGASPGEARNEWTTHLREAPGLPALITDAAGKPTMQLESIERGAIDANKFRPPAGYKKSSKGMFGE